MKNHTLIADVLVLLCLSFVTPAFAQETNETQQLLEIREEWYRAYYAGDTEVLDRIEHDEFVVVGAQGVQGVEGRYETIQANVNAGRWFPKGLRQEMEGVKVRFSDEWALLTGIGVLKTENSPDPAGRVAISEVWVREDGTWKVAHLHFTSIE